jgi:hypothetical protein
MRHVSKSLVAETEGYPRFQYSGVLGQTRGSNVLGFGNRSLEEEHDLPLAIGALIAGFAAEILHIPPKNVCFFLYQGISKSLQKILNWKSFHHAARSGDSYPPQPSPGAGHCCWRPREKKNHASSSGTYCRSDLEPCTHCTCSKLQSYCNLGIEFSTQVSTVLCLVKKSYFDMNKSFVTLQYSTAMQLATWRSCAL